MTEIPEYPFQTDLRDPENELSGWMLSDPVDQRRIRLRVLLHIYRYLMENGEDEQTELSLRWLLQKRKDLFRRSMSEKVALIEGRYFWHPNIPGFPGPAFSHFLENELARDLFPGKPWGASTLYLSLTTRSPMWYKRVLEHVPEGREDALSREALIQIVQEYQDAGASRIVLGGGEPLLRLNDIHAILQAARPGTDFWIDSTGFSLTDDIADQLKGNGLTGVSIRLNHYHEEDCDDFRHYSSAFDWAIRGAVASHRAGLVSALSYYAPQCPPTIHDLEAYLDLARKLGVAFVDFLPPSSTTTTDQTGSDEKQRDLLKTACSLFNSDPAYEDYPILTCDWHQEAKGQPGNTRLTHLFIDAEGQVYSRRFSGNPVCQVGAFPPDLTLQLAEVFLR